METDLSVGLKHLVSPTSTLTPSSALLSAAYNFLLPPYYSHLLLPPSSYSLSLPSTYFFHRSFRHSGVPRGGRWSWRVLAGKRTICQPNCLSVSRVELVRYTTKLYKVREIERLVDFCIHALAVKSGFEVCAHRILLFGWLLCPRSQPSEPGLGLGFRVRVRV